MYKRTLFLSLISLFLLLISSCVSIPPQTRLISPMADKAVFSECNINSIPASLKAPETSFKQLDPQHISIINWNIYKAQRDNWSSDFKALIKNQNLVLLQEAINRPDITKPLQTEQPHWHLNTAFYYDNHEAGVLTASSIPPIYSCGLRATEPLIRIPKTVLINLYPLKNSSQVLLVANLHSINFTLGTDAYAEQILAMSSVIKQHSGPVIIAGDFNSWSNARIEIINTMVNTLSLKSLAYNNHNRIRVFGHALDHVFYRGLEITAEETLKVSSSDHNPIKVSFRLSAQNKPVNPNYALRLPPHYE